VSSIVALLNIYRNSNEWQKKCLEIMKKQEEVRKKMFSAAFIAIMSADRKTSKKRRYWRIPVCAEWELHGLIK